MVSLESLSDTTNFCKNSDTSCNSEDTKNTSVTSDLQADRTRTAHPDLDLLHTPPSKCTSGTAHERPKKVVSFADEPSICIIANREDDEYLVERSHDPYPCDWLNTPSKQKLAEDVLDAFRLGIVPNTPSLTELVSLTAYASKKRRVS